ncbi:hypothetical protein BJ912DRAFT_993791 [Pholiota molesta]|nr:hypothetical protein BJ912DRAFT_993791 [Pholiota molesta]
MNHFLFDSSPTCRLQSPVALPMAHEASRAGQRSDLGGWMTKERPDKREIHLVHRNHPAFPPASDPLALFCRQCNIEHRPLPPMPATTMHDAATSAARASRAPPLQPWNSLHVDVAGDPCICVQFVSFLFPSTSDRPPLSNSQHHRTTTPTPASSTTRRQHRSVRDRATMTTPADSTTAERHRGAARRRRRRRRTARRVVPRS